MLSRRFVSLALEHPSAVALRAWLSLGAEVPDEHFYSTLAADAFFLRDLGERVLRYGDVCVRFSVWTWGPDRCSGRFVNSVCNFGMADLEMVRFEAISHPPRARSQAQARPTLAFFFQIRSSGCLFANKFNRDVSSAAVLCQADYVKKR